MAKVVALFADDAATGQAVEKLSELKVDGLTWDLVRPGADEDRIMPGGYPGAVTGTTGSWGDGRGMAAPLPLQFHEDMGEYLHQRGIPRDEAAYFGRRMRHESTLLIAEVPASHRDEVAKLLEPLAPTRVVED
ncbi:MAG: hypothetical protein ACYC5O_16955 [Anaerolineae bacterium]